MSDDNIPVIDTFFHLLSESKPEAVQVCKHSQTNPPQTLSMAKVIGFVTDLLTRFIAQDVQRSCKDLGTAGIQRLYQCAIVVV